MAVAAIVIILHTGGCAANMPRRIHGDILGAACESLFIWEAIDVGTEVVLPKRTSPVIGMLALYVLHYRDAVTLEGIAAADRHTAALVEAFQSIEVSVPDESSICRWRLDSRLKDDPYSESLVLQLSNPVINPYSVADQEPMGIFVRFSLDGI